MLPALTQIKVERQCGTKMTWPTEWYEAQLRTMRNSARKVSTKIPAQKCTYHWHCSWSHRVLDDKVRPETPSESKCSTDFQMRSLPCSWAQPKSMELAASVNQRDFDITVCCKGNASFSVAARRIESNRGGEFR